MMSHEGRFVFGKTNVGEDVHINMKTTLTKTNGLVKSLVQSPEYKRCISELNMGQTLTPMCMSVRQQAASLNKIEVSMEVPKVISGSPVATLVSDLIKALSLRQIEYATPELSTSSQPDLIKVELVSDRLSKLAQAKISTPTTTMIIRNIRLLGKTKTLFPLSIFNQVLDVLPMKLSSSEIPAACRVEPNTVTTFDNKTVSYRINDCEHVLLVDTSKTLPIAVLAKTVLEQKKEVTILSGVFAVVLTPTPQRLCPLLSWPKLSWSKRRKSPSCPVFFAVVLTPTPSGMIVKINDGLRSLSPGATHVEKSSTGSPMAFVKRYMDNVYMVSIPSQGLTVMSNGVSVEII